NIHIIEYMSQAFGLTAKFYRSSQFEFDRSLKSTEAILAIIKQVGASEFLAGPSGKKYLNQPRFSEEGVTLLFQEYHPIQYDQMSPPFVPGSSAIDLLFNIGSLGRKYLT